MNVILSVYFQEEERHRRAIWEENVKMIKLLSEENGLGMNNITAEMNEFGDMVSVTQTVPHSRSFPLLLFKLSLYVLFLKDWRRDEGNDEGEFSSDSKEWETHPETRDHRPKIFGLEDRRLCRPCAETGMTTSHDFFLNYWDGTGY